MTTALGVAPDANGVGLDPLTHRLLIKQHWNNTGVVMGLTVSGRGDLRYQVSAGAAICSMSAADGYTEAYWNGGVTENAVDAGDSTYSRIDVVYMLSNTGTPDNVVHVMVQQGTPAASPAVPSLPAGGLPLAYQLMPSRGSNTNAATPYGNIDYAIQSGGVRGRLAYERVTADYTVQEDNQWHIQVTAEFVVPTKRLVAITWKAAASVGTNDNRNDANANMGSYFLQILIDGTPINDIYTPVINANADEITVFRYDSPSSDRYEVTVDAGKHTVVAQVFGNKGWLTYPVTFVQQRQITVSDIGVAR